MTELFDDDGNDVSSGLTTVRSVHEVRLVRVVLMLLLLACLGNVLLPEWVNGFNWRRRMLGTMSGNDFLGGILFGVFLAELATLAVWGAMSSWPSHFRWLLMGILSFSLINMFAVGIQFDRIEIPFMGFVVMILGGCGITFGSALILGGLLRRYRVVAGMENRAASHLQTPSALSQYGVRFLLMVMMCVALGSFILRNTLPKNADMWVNGLQLLSISMYFVWLTIGISILTYLEFRVCLGRRTLASVGLFFLCVTLGPMAFQVVSIWIFGLWNNGLLNMSYSLELFVLAYLLTLGVVLGNLIAFLATRWIGFRLVRSGGGEAVLGDGPSGSSGDTGARFEN